MQDKPRLMKKNLTKIGFTFLLCLSLFSSAYLQQTEIHHSATKLEFQEIGQMQDQFVRGIDFTAKLVDGVVDVLTNNK